MLPFDLVPPQDQWPLFDEVLMCASLSPSSSSEEHSPSLELYSLPSSATLAAMPIPPSRASHRKKNPNHIPRPRNAFMLFRSAFAAAQKITAKIEHDNRHITRIIAHCWNRLSDTEKQVWRDKAAAEKAQHAERYPNYRFCPVGRANKPAKRNVRRNGPEDVKRCERLAELVMAGKHGQELETAAKEFDHERPPVDAFTSTEGHRTRPDPQDSKPSDIPPFRSPLLPPQSTSDQVPDNNFMPQPPAGIAPGAHHVEPPLYFPTDASISDDLASLWGSPFYQSYQHTLYDGLSSPRSIPPLGHFHSVMDFVQNDHTEPEQSVPDFSSLFSSNQSDNFSYYY